jgi:hypothetical protein
LSNTFFALKREPQRAYIERMLLFKYGHCA